MEQLITTASQYGIVGIILLACGWYITQRDRKHDDRMTGIFDQHRGERKELIDSMKVQHEEALTQARNASDAMERNTSVLSRLETLISNQSNQSRR